jgi:hypothetical protein
MTYYPRLPDSRVAAIDAGVHLRPMYAAPEHGDGAADVYLPGDGYQHKWVLQDGHLAAAAGSAAGTVPPVDAGEGSPGEHVYAPDKDMSGVSSTRRQAWAFDQRSSEAKRAAASEQLRYSVAGRMGHVLEPVIRPMGFDWKMGVGLVGAFAAREVFVSTMAIVYNAGSDEDTADLKTAMRSDTRPDGKPVWTPLVAISLLIWFVLAMQCMSTLAIVRRETGGWRWPIAMLLYMNGLAYVVCLVVYQVGRVFVA